MKSYLSNETKSGNKYLTDISERFFSIAHPLLSHFFDLEEKDKIIEINNRLPQKITIEAVEYSEKEIRYYYNKYLLLKQNGLKADKDTRKVDFTRITSQHVQQQLANIKHLMFEVTDSCNLKCKYCGYGELYEGYDERTTKFLNFKDMIPFIQYIEQHLNSSQNTSYADKVSIGFYGGEPLLNSTFIYDAVNYFNSKSSNAIKFIFSMTTNAVLLDKHMEFLSKNNFNLLISLDGNKHNHSYRPFHGGQESFDIVFENIKKLKVQHPKYFEDNVNFNSVLHNRNSVEEIYQFIKKEFNKTPKISELTSIGVKTNKKKDFDEIHQAIYSSLKVAKNTHLIKEDLFSRLGEIKSTTNFLHKYSGNVFKSAEELINKKRDKIQILQTGTCLPFSRKLFVTANGKILPCETIGHQFYLGNITPKGLEIDLENIAEKYNNYYKSLKNQCNVCLNKKNCNQCLFHIKNIENNPICERYESSNKLPKHISYYLSKLEEQPSLYNRIMKDILIS